MSSAIRITMFGGIIPRLAKRGLPDSAAQFALNAKLFSGELRAWNGMRALATLPISNAKTVFHYRDPDGLDRYLAFNEYTNVAKAPLIAAATARFYFTGSTGPFQTSHNRVTLGQPPFRLGTPAPGGAFTVVPSGGSTATAETRVYVATFVSTLGEISGPSNPVSASGNADGTWTINGLNSLTYDAITYGNVGQLFLYRTITSATGVDYRQVAAFPVGSRPASYADTLPSTTAASAPSLPSLSWGLPPMDLKGLVSVAGGFLAGFVGRTVRLSVPYFPHAWPEDYQFAVEDDIVALGTFGNTVVIATAGRAYLLVGQTPDAMSLVRMEGVQPCLSARGLVSNVAGVLYPSTDGLVLIDGASNTGQIVSRAWVTKDEWLSGFGPATQMSSVFQDRYFSFYTSQLGFTVGFDDPVTGYTELQLDGVQSVDTDTLTGQTMITIGSTVYEWDGDPTARFVYSWRSKPFQQPKPINYGAIQLRGTFTGSASTIPVPPAQGGGGYSLNSQRIGGPKSGVGPYGGSLNGPPTWLARGESPSTGGAGPGVAVKVYTDGVLTWFGTISDERVYRMPSGFKGAVSEIELQGSVPVFSVAIATSAKALENVP